jgi:hypothetical protein
MGEKTMNRQQKNRQGWIARFLGATKKQKPQRQGRSLVFEGLESRQMLSSMPWLPAAVGTIPSGDYSASVGVYSTNLSDAEIAKASNDWQGVNHQVFQQLEELREVSQGVSPDEFRIPKQPVGSPGASDGPILDFGLGGGDNDSLFGKTPDPSDLSGVGGYGSARTDGLPANAPPSGWGSGGIAGLDVNGEAKVVTADDGTVTKTWVTQTKDGSVVTVESVRTRDGSTSLTTNTRYDSGLLVTESRSKNSDGSFGNSLTMRIVGQPSGTGVEHRRGSDGNYTSMLGSVNEDGLMVWSDPRSVHPDSAPRWMRNITDNPGDEGTTESQQALADWAWRQHKLGRHSPGGSGPPITTLVNPGNADYEGAYVDTPSIGAEFTESIAVNPDPNSASSGGSAPSARAWSMMVDELFSRPGPGFKPSPRP